MAAESYSLHALSGRPCPPTEILFSGRRESSSLSLRRMPVGTWYYYCLLRPRCCHRYRHRSPPVPHAGPPPPQSLLLWRPCQQSTPVQRRESMVHPIINPTPLPITIAELLHSLPPSIHAERKPARPRMGGALKHRVCGFYASIIHLTKAPPRGDACGLSWRIQVGCNKPGPRA